MSELDSFKDIAKKLRTAKPAPVPPSRWDQAKAWGVRLAGVGVAYHRVRQWQAWFDEPEDMWGPLFETEFSGSLMAWGNIEKEGDVPEVEVRTFEFPFTSPIPMAARLGDLMAHGGGAIPGPGSPDVLIGGAPALRQVDQHVCPMNTPAAPHPPGPFITSCSNVLINGAFPIRAGDFTVEGPAGPNPVAVGEPTVWIGSPAPTVMVQTHVLERPDVGWYVRLLELDVKVEFFTITRWGVSPIRFEADLTGLHAFAETDKEHSVAWQPEHWVWQRVVPEGAEARLDDGKMHFRLLGLRDVKPQAFANILYGQPDIAVDGGAYLINTKVETSEAYVRLDDAAASFKGDIEIKLVDLDAKYRAKQRWIWRRESTTVSGRIFGIDMGGGARIDIDLSAAGDAIWTMPKLYFQAHEDKGFQAEIGYVEDMEINWRKSGWLPFPVPWSNFERPHLYKEGEEPIDTNLPDIQTITEWLDWTSQWESLLGSSASELYEGFMQGGAG